MLIGYSLARAENDRSLNLHDRCTDSTDWPFVQPKPQKIRWQGLLLLPTNTQTSTEIFPPLTYQIYSHE